MIATETTILIEGLLVQCRVGAFVNERKLRQPVLIDVACEQKDAIVHSDKLKDTVNYAELVKNIKLLLETKTFVLLETMVEAIAQSCFDTDGRIALVQVAARKPKKIEGCEAVGVKREFAR